MTDYVGVLREFNTPAMSKVAPSTYDQYERMAKEIAELRDRLADMSLAFEGSQILLGDVTRERDRLVRAIDEEMIKCGELGTFSLRDDPRQALHLLAVWNQSMGEYFALRELEARGVPEANFGNPAPVAASEPVACRCGKCSGLGLVDVDLSDKAHPSAAAVTVTEVADRIIYSLDEYARELDAHDYGLPVYGAPEHMVRMRELIVTILTAASERREEGN